MNTILGIDCGLSGAIAVLRDGNLSDVIDMPTARVRRAGAKRRDLDLYELARAVDAIGHIDHAFVELVGPMRHDGASAAFTFGGTYWAARGIIAAHFIPVTLVSPAKWRNALGVKKAEKPGDKTPSVNRANELFPTHSDRWRTKTRADRAEAALIAEYGRRTLCGAGLQAA